MSQSSDYIIINEAELLNEKETEYIKQELNRVKVVEKKQIVLFLKRSMVLFNRKSLMKNG